MALGLQLEGPAEKFLHPQVPIFHFGEHSHSMAGDFSAFIDRDFPQSLPAFYRALGLQGFFCSVTHHLSVNRRDPLILFSMGNEKVSVADRPCPLERRSFHDVDTPKKVDQPS